MATNENIPEEIRNNIGVFNMPAVEGGKAQRPILRHGMAAVMQ